MLCGNTALSGEDLSRYSNKINQSMKENIRNISVSLRELCHKKKHFSELAPHHGRYRYDVRKLRHCHPICIPHEFTAKWLICSRIVGGNVVFEHLPSSGWQHWLKSGGGSSVVPSKCQRSFLGEAPYSAQPDFWRNVHFGASSKVSLVCIAVILW